MKKRILSIVLAVLMLVSVLPISALAADVEPPIAETGVSTKISENTTGPKLEKSAQWVDEKAGIAEITIKVTGEQPTETTKKTDIVLVIDRSLSMTEDDNGRQRDWLKNAKQAAKAFAKKVLTGDPNVRIAVVAYAAKTINDWDFSSKLATVENNIDAINTNNVYYNGQWYANHNSLWSENWHGTNIQAGIHSARERLKKSDKDADKFMIVLADGAPNYRFTYKDWGIGTKFDLTDAQKRTYHINNWFSWLFYATSDAFNYNEVKNTEQYAYTAAASEAYAAKATDGITCYAIGYGIPQGNNEINALMYSIASTDAGFVNAGTDENAITKVFSDIATDIQYKAHDVTLTDTMGAGFTYLANETYPSNPVVTPSAGNKTVTWDVADKLGDETKTLTFYVQYDKQNLTDAATLPTNTSASLSYKDNKGNAQPNITVASPEIENLAFTVTYLDETGTELTAPPYTKTHYWHGDTVAIKDGPAKDGYDFTGWTVTGVTPAEGAKSFDMPKNDVTLKANYTEKYYTLGLESVWIADEGVTPNYDAFPTMISGQQKKFNEKVTLPICTSVVDEENDGVWNFTGWVESRSTLNEKPLGKITEYTMPAKNVELSAVWTFQKTERYGVEVTKTATRDRTLADGTTDTVALATTGDKVRVGDVIHYTVTIKNTGNVAFPAGSHAGDTFAAATGSLIDDATQEKIPSGSRTAPIKIALTEPNVTVTKTYTYIVLEADTRITNTANASIPNGTMEPERDSDAVVVTVEKPHGVTYTFENNDGLPEAVQNLLPAQDTKQYYKGDSVTLPTLTDTTKQVGNTTYSFAGWHVDGVKVTGSTYTMDDKDVTFVGKWNSVTVNPKYKLSYVFKSGDDTITTLPDVVTRQIPADSEELVEKTEVELPHGFEDTADTVNKGTWSFDGWYEDKGLSTKIDGTTYRMPEGGKTLYGKWTFTKDKPEITEAGYTVKYYRQDADGENYTLQEDTDSGVAEVGKEKTIEPAEDKYSGYTYNETESIVTLTIQEEEDKNVFKVYYDAVPGLAVTKTITDVTRDGEPLDPTDPEVEVKEGDVIEYEITVRNSGKLNLTDVVLTDEFTGAEGDLTFISGDDYTVDGYEITLKNGLNVGDSVTIKATYEVQLGDSGYEISNKAIGAAKDALGGDVTGESERVTIRPDALKAYRIFGSAYKYVKSEKGTFNKDGETVPFEFKVTSDKKGEEILDTFTIDVDETVKAGETSEGDWGGFDFNLSEEEFENLDKKEFNGKEYPVVYLWELKGDLKNMSYSTKRITLYLDRPNISYYSAREPKVEYLGTRMAYADPDKGAGADIINIYGKQSSSGDTVKVGPQLNRDDHVAYIMGYPDGTVQPEGEITRAEACTIFFRLLTDSSRDYYFSKTNDYTDVNAGDWFNNAISTLSNAGIVTGYNDGTFRPNQPITRGEMAKIIANFANLNKGTKSFTDLSGHWSKSYVELAAGNGWIAGYPDGSFRPDQKITRAETVTMINRVLERVPAKELRLLSRSIMLTFPDNNPGDWYYIAIQEASNSHEYQRSVYETTGDEMWTKLIDNVDWTKLEK